MTMSNNMQYQQQQSSNVNVNMSQQQQQLQQQDDKVIVSFPLNYIYFIKPSVTINESLVPNHWRLEDYSTNPSNTLFQQLPPGSHICDNLPDLRNIVNKVNETSTRDE
ncbi:unnamed protein product [Ambrosiozyma monospora]|uniref:Unnamed protein product n=1 Tax=Ambrosiozyma monospora TaxID=43982 RepID=A0ACB5U007_AMBMO|nr:unnamed protein product [Ambrosiozyma monospora]